MDGDLFSEAPTEPKAPTQAWLTDWDRRLQERRLPPLSERERKQLAKTDRRLWEQRGQDGDLILALQGQWFERGGRWANVVGYSVEGFIRWIRSGLLEVDAARTKQAAEAARKAREAERLRAVTQFEGTPASMETVKKVKAALFGRKELRQ